MTAQPPPVQARPPDKNRQDQTGKEERSDDVVYLEKNLSRKICQIDARMNWVLVLYPGANLKKFFLI